MGKWFNTVGSKSIAGHFEAVGRKFSEMIQCIQTVLGQMDQYEADYFKRRRNYFLL